MTPHSLSEQIARFAAQWTEALVARFLPDFVIPRFFCGHWRPGSAEEANLAYLLAHLHRLEVREIAGVSVPDAITRLLRCVDGPKTETFYSFFLADALLAFGPFESNPLLASFSAAERENIRSGTDTTHIYDPATKWIGGWANNYWAVLARSEWTRQQLGILTDGSILEIAVGQLQQLLFENPLGFFNDGKEERRDPKSVV